MSEITELNHEQRNPDVELGARGPESSFDSLLSDEVVVDWLMRLEREQEHRAVG
ncbi:hypothetical protein G4Y73_00445 [Wenzhouxiangella sp. XN201]|uniref:hypothetical protein n=1 Tax=Wenzhouxiangella sp. XN201 TaxID=2710755 RepID=UPI0013C6F328|nr:hypothetical protein [Wenzhouxiangella sp. XN201]NEZ02613.1 hypothetical protein [Wenzhouxiangella sp. XN201]